MDEKTNQDFTAICTVISGGLISVYGVYVPWLYAGSVICTIGMGLIYTLDIGSPSSHWIGYQALAGIGMGLGFQVPIIANQAFVDMSEISSITAVTLCKSSRKLIFFPLSPLLSRSTPQSHSNGDPINQTSKMKPTKGNRDQRLTSHHTQSSKPSAAPSSSPPPKPPSPTVSSPTSPPPPQESPPPSSSPQAQPSSAPSSPPTRSQGSCSRT